MSSQPMNTVKLNSGHYQLVAQSYGNNIVLVNPENRSYTENNYVLAFGAYGWTKLRVWEDNLQDAIDTAIDYLAEHAPGLLCDDQVNEAYNEAIAEGMSEEEAQEQATEDTISGGNCGHYILSYEWGIVAENPNRKELQDLLS